MNVSSTPDLAAEVPVDPHLVESLAREFGLPAPAVASVLREELERLTAKARITTYLAVLATSRARLRLRAAATSH